MNNEAEIIPRLKSLIVESSDWADDVEEYAATYGNLQPSAVAALSQDKLWKLWTAVTFAQTGTPSLPTPAHEQWDGLRKMTQILCDRTRSLGDRFNAAKDACAATFTADQLQLPVVLRTLLVLEGGRFGTVATKGHTNRLLQWVGKPAMDYTNPASITIALENVRAVIEEWAPKVGATSLGERACIAWHLCEILRDKLAIFQPSAAPLTIPQNIEGILNQYLVARTSAPFTGNHPICQFFEALKTTFSQIPTLRNRPNLIIKWSAGQGNWARVPWLVLMDRRETASTQRGVYCVYLFRQDMSGVYLTFNQGVTEPCEKLGRADGLKALKNRARIIRQGVPELGQQGFSLADDIDLKADPGLGADYETSTIAHKFYPKGSVPLAAELISDLEAVLQAYDRYLTKPVSLGEAASSVGNFQSLGFPFNEIFRSFEEGLWGFDLLQSTLLSLGVDPAGAAADRRISLTLIEQSGEGVRLRLNFGNWAILTFLNQSVGVNRVQFICREDLLPASAPPVQEGYRFADEIDGHNFVLTSCPTDRLRNVDSAERKAFEATLPGVAQRFQGWESSPFRKSHQTKAIEMVFDSEVRGELLRTGLSLSPDSVNHWIFQGHPDLFDIESYLKERDTILWKTNQHREKIHVGDHVLLWRAKVNSGVIAACTVEAEPALQADDALDKWKHRGEKEAYRCRLKIDTRFVEHPITRDAIKAALPDLSIIKQAAGTNFPISAEEYATILSLQSAAPTSSSLQSILQRYHDEQIIFVSSAEKVHYAIAAIDANGVDVQRLDANEPQRVTFAKAAKLIEQVREQEQLDFASLNQTAAVRNAVLQAEPLALSGDQESVLFLADNEARTRNLCAALAAMNRSQPLYKPAMLLCVLDGLDSGELDSNQIAFDWIAPRFIALMDKLGQPVTEQQAAQPFFHLTTDLFWLHAVNDLNDPMEAGDGPNAARTKVHYALFKDTYWNLLQAPTARTAVRYQLEKLIMHTPDQLLAAAEQAISKIGFHCPDGLVGRFLGALAAKPFVILTGNSGTGKTKLATLLAHWLAGDASESNHRYSVVPVGADWTDNRNVVGFVNHLRKNGQGNPTYQTTPVLELLLRAKDDPHHPYFLILDEMNLSHVERYFADFLSAMESKKPIPLHHEEESLRTPSGALVPPALAFPENLFVIGTVNVDETTYMFSPKVLDRANVLEFRIGTEQAKVFLAQKGKHVAATTPALAAPLGFLDLSRRARGLAEPALASPSDAALKECRDSLQGFFDLLHSARLEFAFRTINEITRYLHVDFEFAADKAAWAWESCLDAQVLQKILPKLHGSRRRLEAILIALATYCEKRDLEAANKPLQRDAELGSYPPAAAPSAIAFPLSRTKLLEMIEAVRRDQFVSFIQ